MKRLYSFTNEIKFESLDLELELFKKPVFVVLATIQNFPSRFHELKKFYQNGQLFHMYLRVVPPATFVITYVEQIQDPRTKKYLRDIIFQKLDWNSKKKNLSNPPLFWDLLSKKGPNHHRHLEWDELAKTSFVNRVNPTKNACSKKLFYNCTSLLLQVFILLLVSLGIVCRK